MNRLPRNLEYGNREDLTKSELNKRVHILRGTNEEVAIYHESQTE